MRDENIHIRPSIAITKAVRILGSVFPLLDPVMSLEICSGSQIFRSTFRGTISSQTRHTDFGIITQHMKLPELEQSVRDGRIVPDNKICLNDSGELAVTKFAVEPVWYLPGVAERFGIGTTLVQAL